MARSVLLALDGSPASDVAQNLAIEFSKRHGTTLAGMGVLDTPTITAPEAAPLGGGGFKAERDEALLDDARRRIATFLDKFRTSCEAAGVTVQIIRSEGLPQEQIARESIRHDLIFIGRDTNFQFETSNETGATVRYLVRNTARPVVVVPATPPKGEAVVIAFDGSLQAARALQVAALLRTLEAASVHVVSVATKSKAAAAACDDAIAYLETQHFQAERHAIESKSHPADIVLAEAEALRARLIVMGAFGTTGLREMFLGSFSRTMLEKSTVPLLIYH